MHVIRDPSRERNIGEQIVRPAIGIATGAAAHICDDAGGLREAGPGLAKAQSRTGGLPSSTISPGILIIPGTAAG